MLLPKININFLAITNKIYLLMINMLHINDEIFVELNIDIKKRINLYNNDNDHNYNWFEVKYEMNVDTIKFYIKIDYDDQLYTLKSYKPEKTLPYNYDTIEKNKAYYVDSLSNIDDYKNFYIEINKKTIKSFTDKISIEIVTQSNYVIRKNITVYFNPLSKMNDIVTYNENNIDFDKEVQNFMYNSINFDNLVVSDILYPESIVATLQYNNINIQNIKFTVNNKYFDLVTINDLIRLILKYPLIKCNDEYIIVNVNTTYTYQNKIITFDKSFNFKINKYYTPLVKIDQNNFVYVNESCWLQYTCTKLLPVTIKLFKQNSNGDYELYDTELSASFFIPKEKGIYRLLIYNYFDKIESSKYIVEDKPMMQSLLEKFIEFCKSN
jgi:hypothetical protein